MARDPFPEFDRSWLEMAPYAHPAFRSGRGISRYDGLSVAVFSTRRCTPSPEAALDAYRRGELEAGCFVTAPDRYEIVLVDVRANGRLAHEG